MVMMLNIVPVDAKANTSLQNTNKKSNDKSDKLVPGFAATLTKQADKNEASDGTSNGKDEVAARLMAAFAGIAVLPPPVNLIECPKQGGEIVPETVNSGQVETVAHLFNLVGNNQPQIDLSASGKAFQNHVEALLPKMTGINESVNISNVAEFVQTQANFLGKAPTEQMVEPVQEIDSSLKEAETLLNTVPSIVMENGVIKNNSKQSIESKKITSSPGNTGGVTTADLAELIGNDVKIKLDIQPPIVNTVAAVKEDNNLNGLVSGTKEQLHTEGILPDKAANNSEIFSSLLNQPVVKNESQVTVADTKQVQQQPVKDPYHITSQVVDQARLIEGQKNTEMIIRLKPEHLGELSFKVTVENGAVSASFHSNNAEVRNILEASLMQLKQELSNQGLKVENVGIYAGLGEFFSNGQRESQKKPEVKVQNRKVEEDFIEALESSNVSDADSDSPGVDYRV
jgi:flagellar hook-length control protein FliK